LSLFYFRFGIYENSAHRPSTYTLEPCPRGERALGRDAAAAAEHPLPNKHTQMHSEAEGRDPRTAEKRTREGISFPHKCYGRRARAFRRHSCGGLARRNAADCCGGRRTAAQHCQQAARTHTTTGASTQKPGAAEVRGSGAPQQRRRARSGGISKTNPAETLSGYRLGRAHCQGAKLARLRPPQARGAKPLRTTGRRRAPLNKFAQRIFPR
jgi:hypothetical protein